MRRVATTAFICLVLFNLTNPFSSAAQTFSAIKGLVKDAETGNGLPGANVIIAGTSRGASTAGDGSFVIARVRPGNYNLVVNIIGYKTENVSVTAEAGSDATVELQL
ncbi:MAG: carboxypeptidase-like regulatory domain-containing protein, partial [bacterium]